MTRQEKGVADGVAAADFDLDGFVDVVISNGQGIWPFNVGTTQLYRNSSRFAGNTNRWLEVDLRGVKSNRDGVGAKLVLNAAGKLQRRMQRNGVHNGAQDHQRIHFGLGVATRVDSLEIHWPSGTRQVLTNLPVNKLIRVTEGQQTWTTAAAGTTESAPSGDAASNSGEG